MLTFNRTSESEPALCLSGGGFRAALFHLGALRRLNELGVLSRVSVMSSVSGGSILNGVVAANWSSLSRVDRGVLQDFDEQVARPVREFCRSDLRTPLIIGQRLNPRNWLSLAQSFLSISGNVLAKAYDTLYGGKLLRE